MFVGLFTDHLAVIRYTHPGTTRRCLNIHDGTGELFDLGVPPIIPLLMVINLFNVDSVCSFFLVTKLSGYDLFQDDIEKMVSKLEEKVLRLEEGSCMDAIILPLHGSLPPEMQARFTLSTSFLL